MTGTAFFFGRFSLLVTTDVEIDFVGETSQTFLKQNCFTTQNLSETLQFFVLYTPGLLSLQLAQH